MLCLFCSQQRKALLALQSLATQRCSAPISFSCGSGKITLLLEFPFMYHNSPISLAKLKNCYWPHYIYFLHLQLRTELLKKHKWRKHHYYPPFQQQRMTESWQNILAFFQSCLLFKGAITIQKEIQNRTLSKKLARFWWFRWQMKKAAFSSISAQG